MKIPAYLKQPSTILGFAGMAASITGGAAAYLLSGTAHGWLAWPIAAGTGSLVHILMPDNSDSQTAIEKTVSDTVVTVVEGRINNMLPMLQADALAAVLGLTAPPRPVAEAAPVPAPAAPTPAPAPAPAAAPGGAAPPPFSADAWSFLSRLPGVAASEGLVSRPAADASAAPASPAIN